MVCKEEVVVWFKNLNGYKRIEVMCGLLNMCSPFELRFFGTCVEDLGKKDFHCLRDAERKANTSSELTTLTDLNDDVVRRKLVIYLALLESSNHVCSNVIFKTLTDAEKLENISTSPYDEKIIDEIFLLYTMALHHPAFTFEQKTTFGQHLMFMEKCFNQTSSEDYKQEIKRKDETLESSKITTGGCSRVTSFNNTANKKKYQVSVKHLDLKRTNRKKNDKRSDLRIQVSWSNGDTSEITKSYQELCDFSNKVQVLLEEMRNSGNQDKNIPVLLGLRQINGNKSEEIGEDIFNRTNDYLHQLVRKMPQVALECELITSFFRGGNFNPPYSQQWSNAVTSLPPYSNQNPITGTSHNMGQSPNGTSRLGLPTEEPITESGCVKSLTIYNSQIDHSEKKIQETKGKLPSGAVLNSLGNNPSASHQVIGSSPVISPHPSPVSSPFASPSQSGTSSRAASPWTPRSNSDSNIEAQTTQQLFKHDKLRKHANKFINYSVDEIRMMSDEELSKEGLNSSDICLLKKQMETWRGHPPNGLSFHVGKNSPLTVPLIPSSVTTAVSTVGLSSSVMHSDVSTVVSQQVYMVPTTENQARPMNHPMLPQSMPHSHLFPVSSLNSVLPVGGSSHSRQICNAHQTQQQRPYVPQHFQTHQSQHYQASQHWGLNTENSPSCSEYSSPPGSPITEAQTNNYDSSCSEEIDKDKDSDKSFRSLEHTKMKNAPSSKQRKASDNKSSSKLNCKSRSDEENSSAHTGNLMPLETSSLTSVRHVGSDVPSQVASSVQVANSSGNLAAFQRPRLNSASSPSPPGTAIQMFKSGSQHLTSASPVRSANTMIFENSQLMKTLPAAAVTPSLTANAHNRWENVNGNCPSVNGPHPQSPNSNMFIITSAPALTIPNNVSYRTSNTVVSTSVVVTCASRYPMIVTTGNISGMRQQNKLVTGQHPEELQKINSNLNQSLPSTSACCLLASVHGTEPSHVLPNYPPMPISYPTMSPSTVASTTVTYTTPAITAVNSGQSGNGHNSNPITQNQLNQGMLSISSGGNSCGCSCNSSTQPGNLAYSPGFLPLHQINSPAVFPSFHNFLQHNSNGFISPTMPNFTFHNNHLAAAAAGGLPNGIAPELIYSGTQFPILQQNGNQHSNTATPGFLAGPNVGFHNYSNPPNQQHVPKVKHCYNCGVVGHRGLECKEASMEEITKGGQFRLNYAPSKSMDNTE